MSSLKMRIAISKKIQEDFNLSSIFLLGAILPDIIKLIIGNRETTHFEKQGIIDLDEFISKQKNLENELVLGYYAHLIEDKIWYELYMREKYFKLPEYSDNKLYNDYSFVDNIFYKDRYIDMNTRSIGEILHEAIEKININDICLSDGEIEDIIDNDNIKSELSKIWKDYSSDGNNYFYTIHDATEYYELCLEKVKEYFENLKLFNKRRK